MKSCLEDTDEKSNGSKLSRLLIDGGTEQLQKTFDGIHPPATLAAALHAQLPVLTRLRHKRIINSSQWDKLFLPSGAAPDSKQFDITLLYILLRNICGLTPPATGWNALPLATDTTLEANLARIKFYRNEVYGHISSTWIPKTEFEHYWKEISGALVVLGMDQISIDILKTSPLGTIDYLILLDEWRIGDQTLKEVTVDAMKETERTREFAEKTKTEAERTRMIAEDTKREAKKTAEIIKETKSEIEKARLTADETHEIAEQAARESEKARIFAEEVKIEAKKIGKGLEKLSDEVNLLTQLQQLKEDGSVLSKLARSNFTGHIKSLTDHQHPGTRTWILSDIQEFVDSYQSQLMVVTARPGVGKSVLAAITSQTMQGQGQLAACHFIDHGNSLRNSPRLIIQSIANHLCDSVPGFQQTLEEQLSRDVGKELNNMKCKELFTLLIEEPLNEVEVPGKSKLIVIDALDECDPNQKEEFVKALEHVLPKLPKWMKCLVTTRPIRGLIPSIPLMKIVSIKSENENGVNNLDDIKLYLAHHLQELYPIASHHKLQAAASIIAANATDGIFLIAYFVVDFARTRNPDLSKIHQMFPKGISSVYKEYFTRLDQELSIEEDQFFHFLEAVVAAQGPLPETLVLEILGLNGSSRKVKKEARQTLTRLSQLFMFKDKHLNVFHKSLVDWLTETEEHDFSVNAKDGHHILAQHCLPYLWGVKKHESSLPALDDCERYALEFGFCHMEKAGGLEKELRECLTDLEIINTINNTFRNVLSSDFMPFFMKSIFSFSRFGFIGGPCYNTFPHQVLQAAVVLSSPPHGMVDSSMHFCRLLDKLPDVKCEKYIDQHLINFQKQAVTLLGTPKYRDVLYIDVTELECELLNRLEYIGELQVSSSNKYIVCVGKVKNDEGSELYGVSQRWIYNISYMTMIMTYCVNTRKCLASVGVQEAAWAKCVISQDDRYVSVLTDSYYELRDILTLQLHKRLEADSEPLCACFLQDGKHLVTGYEDGKIRVWDVESGTVGSTLRGHSRIDLCIASPCTGQVLTVDDDGLSLFFQSPHHPWAISVTDRVTIPKITPATAAFSTNGTKVALHFHCQRGRTELYSTAGGKLTKVRSMFHQPLRYCGFLTFITNTRILVEGREGNTDHMTVAVLNVDSGNEQLLKPPYAYQKLRFQKTERDVPELLCVEQLFCVRPKLVSFKLHNIC